LKLFGCCESADHPSKPIVNGGQKWGIFFFAAAAVARCSKALKLRFELLISVPAVSSIFAFLLFFFRVYHLRLACVRIHCSPEDNILFTLLERLQSAPRLPGPRQSSSLHRLHERGKRFIKRCDEHTLLLSFMRETFRLRASSQQGLTSPIPLCQFPFVPKAPRRSRRNEQAFSAAVLEVQARRVMKKRM
jgi:hypothetical protein